METVLETSVGKPAEQSADDLIDTLLLERSTCDACQFKTCPTLACVCERLRTALHCRDARYSSVLQDRSALVSRLVLALRKIREYTANSKDDMTTDGYIHRVASNALNDTDLMP